ncbi:MAG: hypothetical protein AAGF12_19660 [Myxococcota bacterium]
MRGILVATMLVVGPSAAWAQDDDPWTGDDGDAWTGDDASEGDSAGDDGDAWTGDDATGDGGDAWTGDEEGTDSEEPPSSSVVGPEGDGGEAEAGPGWERPTILLVPLRRTPDRLVRQVAELLEPVGDLSSADDYAREARARGLPPESDEAFEAVLPELDVDLVMVVGVRAGRRSRRNPRPRRIHIVYREGRFGMALLDEEHDLPGDRLLEGNAQRVVSEARLALAVITRPEASRAAPSPIELPTAPPAREGPGRTPGTAVQVVLSAGGGFGMRSFELPDPDGLARLSTSPFPSAEVALGLDVEPTARAPLRIGGRINYRSSIGLRTSDRRLDGTERETSSRSHRLDLWLTGSYRLTDAVEGPRLAAALGWGIRLFSSEAPVNIPDYALGGPQLQLGIVFPIVPGLVRVALRPEVALILTVDEALRDRGFSSTAVAVGGEAEVQLRLTGPFYAGLRYRESHALLSAADSVSDVERYLAIVAEYRP